MVSKSYPQHNEVKRLLVSGDLKLNNLNLIRLLLAIAVMFSHCYYIYYGAEVDDIEPLKILTRHQESLGGLAVDCFFIISGFLIMHSYLHSDSVITYIKRRILRICPGFIVAFLSSVLIFAPLGTIDSYNKLGYWKIYFQYMYKKNLLVQLITFQQPFPTLCFKTLPLSNFVNGSLWSIQYELIGYLLVVVIGMAGITKRKWIGISLFLFFLTTLALQTFKSYFQFSGYNSLWLGSPVLYPRLFVYFFSGICFYLYRNRIPRNNLLAILSVTAIAVSWLFVPALNVVFPVAGSYLLFYVAYSSRIQFYDFAKKSDISYGVYLYAWPITQLTLYAFQSHLDPYRLFFIALPVTIVIATISWKLIEKPCIEFKSKKIKKQMEVEENGLETLAVS